MNKILSTLIIILSLCFSAVIARVVKAEGGKVDYKGEVIIDSDLDGLTDEGEKQIYHTDPNNPDSDGDGIFDGTEVLNGTDPLDSASPAAVQTITQTIKQQQGETPWTWYIVRASGLVGFIILYALIFLGLAARIPVLKKIVPSNSLEIHCWLSIQAFTFIMIHGLAVPFDKFMQSQNVTFASVLIPFASPYHPALMALGIIGAYIMLVLMLTSYFKRLIPYRFWRTIHYLSIALYVFAVIHSFLLGTDFKNNWVWSIFFVANGVLVILIFANIFFKMTTSFENKDLRRSNGENNLENISNQESNENIYQSAPSSIAGQSEKTFRKRL
ncbi:MAG: ferric reductase-like transmembrane domain-containing protein [bacterium]|nr:ferric reductase-like transmembrane domain-containing protein [bacterium]